MWSELGSGTYRVTTIEPQHPRDEDNEVRFVIIPMMCPLSPSLSISSNNAVYFV
jgi:hypothetical protein